MRERELSGSARIASAMNCLPEAPPDSTPTLLLPEHILDGDYVLETFPGDAYAWVHVHGVYPYRPGLHAIRDCYGNEHLYPSSRWLTVFRRGGEHDSDLFRS